MISQGPEHLQRTPSRWHPSSCPLATFSLEERFSARIRLLLDMVEYEARRGVDYMTIHAGVLPEYVPLTAIHGVRPSVDGLTPWMKLGPTPWTTPARQRGRRPR